MKCWGKRRGGWNAEEEGSKTGIGELIIVWRRNQKCRLPRTYGDFEMGRYFVSFLHFATSLISSARTETEILRKGGRLNLLRRSKKNGALMRNGWRCYTLRPCNENDLTFSDSAASENWSLAVICLWEGSCLQVLPHHSHFISSVLEPAWTGRSTFLLKKL